MFVITREDFAIRASNFDLSKPWNLLRIMSGACMFPHMISKFAAGGLAAGTVGFFAKAGFQPPELFVVMAALAELVAGTALLLGICTRFAALGAAGVLAMAVYAVQMVKGFAWTWNTGGHEYNVFWAVVCLTIAMNEFQRLSERK